MHQQGFTFTQQHCRQHRHGRRELGTQRGIEALLNTLGEAGATRLEHPRQPVRAALEHIRQQLFEPAPVIVEAIEQQFGRCRSGTVLRRKHQAATRGALIQRRGGRRDLKIWAGSRRDRQLRGQPVIQRIHSLDAQP